MAEPFREQQKERLSAEVPIEICDQVRERAAKERRSISEASALLLCIGLGIDPHNFGIETAPKAKRVRTPATAAASA